MTPDAALARAEAVWGVHPMNWPRPPQHRPRWYEWRAARHLANMEAVFGPLSDAAMLAYWREASKGQSVYEDAGGGMLRCYRAMLGEEVEEPYTYRDAIADLTRSALSTGNRNDG